MRGWARYIAASLFAALLVAALPSTAMGRPPAAVRIAVAGPLTAGAVAWGLGMERGARLALSDYASELASTGVSASIQSYDDQGDPKTAVDRAIEIVADSAVLGVVGHINSGCSIPSSRVYAEHDLAMITPVSTNPALTQQGLNNVFRTCATDVGQAGFAGETATRSLRAKTAYVVNDSTPYGEILTAGFSRRFKTGGGRVVGSARTSDKQTNFASLVRRIKAKNPSVVYYGGIYNAGSLLARQLRDKGVKATFVGADGIYDPLFVSLAGRRRVEGALATSVGIPLDQQPGGVAFRQRYLALFPGEEPQFTDAYAYDAAAAILKATIAVANEGGLSALEGSDARERVRVKVAQSQFDGVTGGVAFGSAGDTRYPAFSAWRVKSGSWKPCAVVSKAWVPASVGRNKYFTVSGYLKPHHAVGAKVVTLRFYRKIGTKWRLGKTVWASVADVGVFSRYTANVKLTPRGTWRVIATHSDGSHPALDSIANIFKVR
jgi:branched-chain amino acid transport system substrate-binding protein